MTQVGTSLLHTCVVASHHKRRGLTSTCTCHAIVAEELISSLRAKLAKATGWAADDFRIIFAGKQLEDHRTVGA